MTSDKFEKVTNAVLIDFEDREPTPTGLWTKIAFILFLILSIVGLVASFA